MRRNTILPLPQGEGRGEGKKCDGLNACSKYRHAPLQLEVFLIRERFAEIAANRMRVDERLGLAR